MGGEKLTLNDETISAIGATSLAIGILIGRFLYFELSGFSVSDFLGGVFIGLSLVMNVSYLIRLRSKRVM
jgi:hypothetical protein